MKKILYAVIALTIISIIYFGFSRKEKYYYLALGDSLAVGQNSYGGIGYGYSDYLSDYLKNQKELKVYTKGFAHSGYRITDLVNDIDNNVSIELEKKLLTIKHALVKANLITLSIGGNDLLYKLKISTMPEEVNNDEAKQYVDQVMADLNDLLKMIRIYSKEEILLVGYYNPLPKLTNVFDEIFVYANNETKKVANKYNVTYINIYKIFNENPSYLPNPLDVHPNIAGYEAISNQIIKKMSNK